MGNEFSLEGRRSQAGSSTNSPCTARRRPTPRLDEVVSNFCETGGDFGLSFAETLSLTAYQHQQLLQTWPKVVQTYAAGGGYPVMVFQMLNQRNPAAKTLFQKTNILDGFAGAERRCTDMREHGRLLGELFESAIKGLNGPVKDMVDKCQEIGLNHISLNGHGMTGRMWDDLGDCLIDVVCRANAVRKSREAAKAWASLVSFLVDNMKNAYQSELRRRLSASPRLESKPFVAPEDEAEACVVTQQYLTE